MRLVPGPQPFGVFQQSNGTLGRVNCASSACMGNRSKRGWLDIEADTFAMTENQKDCVSRWNSKSLARYRASTYACRSNCGVNTAKSSTNNAGKRHIYTPISQNIVQSKNKNKQKLHSCQQSILAVR